MIRRIIRVIKRDGVSLFLIRLLAKILHVDIGYQAAKNKAWQILEKKYGHVIAYGPFKGMKLSDDVWWSKNDRITQMLGIYEEHVLERLKDFSTQGASRFVDIGAADGYFAIGMAYSKIYSKVDAFEIEPKGQNSIKTIRSKKFFLYWLDLTTLLAVCESTKSTRTTKGLHTNIINLN